MRHRLYLFEDGALFVGRVPPGRPHRHHAVQLCLALDEQPRVRVQGRAWMRAMSVVLGADVEHEVEASGGAIALVFADPDSSVGRALQLRLGDGDMMELCEEDDDAEHLSRRLETLRSVTDAAQARAWVEALFAALVPERAPVVLDHRIADVLRSMQEPDGPARSISDVAATVGLSTSRLRALFSAQIGIPLRRYRLWARARRAVEALQAGEGVTRAAHEAGFADAAHLTRTFRELFGVVPSSL